MKEALRHRIERVRDMTTIIGICFDNPERFLEMQEALIELGRASAKLDSYVYRNYEVYPKREMTK